MYFVSYKRPNELSSSSYKENQLSNIQQTSLISEKTEDSLMVPTIENLPLPLAESTAVHKTSTLTATSAKENSTAVQSTVIGEEGGKLECFGCK